jgi:hypothetical protein
VKELHVTDRKTSKGSVLRYCIHKCSIFKSPGFVLRIYELVRI